MPEDPKQELLVALAGPAVNVVLAGLLFLGVLAAREVTSLTDLTWVGGRFLAKMMWVNVGLALFNLLPAFPMDGGRVLRGLLAMRMDYVRATQIAANIGQGMAFLFGLVGLFYNPFLVFIALFVWMGAAQEAGLVQVKAALGGIPVQRVMITDFKTLAPTDSLGRAIEHLLAGSQQDFPVLEDGRVVGVLTRTDLISGLAKGGQELEVSTVMRRQFETAEATEMAETVLARLQLCDCHTAPVMRQGALVGIVNMENVGEFLMIEAALHGETRTVGPVGARIAHRAPA